MGVRSKQLLCLHMNRLIELHTEIMSWIASDYECRLCMGLTCNHIICTVCEQPAVDGWIVDKQKGAVRALTWAVSAMAADAALWQ